jgi:hypothetical protein
MWSTTRISRSVRGLERNRMPPQIACVRLASSSLQCFNFFNRALSFRGILGPMSEEEKELEHRFAKGI